MNNEKYSAAIETHRFYDTLSMSVVGGIITVAGATIYLLEKFSANPQKAGVITISIFVLVALLAIYRKCAYYANVARNVASYIESDECDSGVSTVLRCLNKDEFTKYRADKKFYRGIYGWVHFLAIALILGFTFLAIALK